MAKIVDIKEFHRELTDTFKTNYPHLKYCDAELGKNEEHGRFLLGPDPKHWVQIVHEPGPAWASTVTLFWIGLSTLSSLPSPKKLKQFWFLLKLVRVFDTSLFPAVHCLQYRGRRVNAVNILIDKDDLSMDLVLAVLETMLVDYMIK
jgi:hypothetical protein